MAPKQQIIKGLTALIGSLDSTPVVRAKPMQDDEEIPLYNVQNSIKAIPNGCTTIQSQYTEDHLRDMFTLKPLSEIKPRYK